MTAGVHPRVRPGRRLRSRRRVPRALPRDRGPVRRRRAAVARSTSPTAARSTIADDDADLAFSYITLQHCQHDDALALSREAVRVAKPGGHDRAQLPHLDRRRRRAVAGRQGRARAVAGARARAERWPAAALVARLGWQANRLSPDEVLAAIGRPARSTSASCARRTVAAFDDRRHAATTVDVRRRQPQPLVARRRRSS